MVMIFVVFVFDLNVDHTFLLPCRQSNINVVLSLFLMKIKISENAYLWKHMSFLFSKSNIRDVSTGDQDPLQFLNRKRSRNFSFKHQRLYWPKISRFSLCVLQFLDNIQRLPIFSNYTEKTDHFSLDFLKRSDN